MILTFSHNLTQEKGSSKKKAIKQIECFFPKKGVFIALSDFMWTFPGRQKEQLVLPHVKFFHFWWWEGRKKIVGAGLPA